MDNDGHDDRGNGSDRGMRVKQHMNCQSIRCGYGIGGEGVARCSRGRPNGALDPENCATVHRQLAQPQADQKRRDLRAICKFAAERYGDAGGIGSSHRH